MAKSKTTTSKPEATVQESAQAEKPARTKTPKKAAESVPSTPVVTDTEPEVVNDVILPVEEEETLLDLTARYLAKLQEANALLVSLKTEYRSIEKRWSRELKTAQKTSGKKKKKNTNRQPSGFVKPTRISEELAVFLGKENGVEMARTQVTREINNYIRANSLQDTANGRHINPDAKLSALLKIPAGENLTYFNLQKYMSPHFFKNVKAVAPV
jgi:upstream activation factor subunit UAF30